MSTFGFIPTFFGNEESEKDYHEDGHIGVHFIDRPHFDGVNYRPDYVDVYVHIYKDGRTILILKDWERYEAVDTYPQLVRLFEEWTGERLPQEKRNLCYYSTNKAMRTIHRIREERELV